MQNYDLKSLFPTYSLIEGYAPTTAVRSGDTDYANIDMTSNYPMLDKIIINQIDMCNNIFALGNDINFSSDNDILDEKGNMKPTGRLVDVARQDVQYILVQQNTLYMIGTMTIATLLITAILISNK
jgi:hypothetical protein